MIDYRDLLNGKLKTMKLRNSLKIILLWLTVGGGPTYAQVGELRKNLSIGFNGGVNLSSASFTINSSSFPIDLQNFSPTIQQKKKVGMNGGFTARYISEKYFSMICGAQVELNFSQYGWEEYYEDYPHLSYTRTMNYLEIPFLAHLAFGRDRGIQFFIHAGPQIAFFIGDSESLGDGWEEFVDRLSTEQHGKSVDNKFNYGITGGAGLEFRTKKSGHYLLEGRYHYALSDFYKNAKKDYFSRSAHGVITIKLTYLFDLKK